MNIPQNTDMKNNTLLNFKIYFSTIMINVAMCLCLLVLICVIAPCLFRILNQSVSALSTEFHTYALKNKKGGDVGSHVRHY